jgi:uncharacterized membrane protein
MRHPLRRRTVVSTSLAAAGLLAAAVLATPASAAAVGTAKPAAATAMSGSGCTPTATRLPDLGYSNIASVGGFAGGISGDTIAGWVADSTQHPQPAIWRHGQLELLHPPGSTYGNIFDINARGDILGVSNGGELAWVRTADGAYHVLPNPVPGSPIYARRINVVRQVAGAVGNFGDAARWPSPDAAPKLLPKRATDTEAVGRGINDWGQVVGDVDLNDWTPYPAKWDPNGTLHVLPGVFGPETQGLLFVNNDVGQAAGENWLINKEGTQVLGDVAVRYSPTGVPSSLGTLPGDNGSTAYGISPLLGFVGGDSYTVDVATFEASQRHAFVWPGHGPLLTLPVPGLTYEQSNSQVHGITDSGTALGWAGPAGGVMHPYIWTCAFAQGFVPPAGTASKQAASGSAKIAKGLLRRAGAALEGGGGPQTAHR